ncbi:MAG: hypothetical protein OHK0013_15840 [Sandaracinaceae bacterium]
MLDHLGARSGTILGRYELVRRIGRGGMAEVYEAVHRGLKKSVAIKVLLPEVADNEELRARFLREGEAASRIRHPHVVDVTDVGEDDGVAYLVMELLEGEALSDVLEYQGRLTVIRTLDVLLPIAAALVEAHRRGVVHRDLKPENVFIARAAGGRAVPKLLDIGVSKLTTEGIPSMTAVSAVLGTPHYMAPEQAMGLSPIDARADQYSFALMVYECIAGTLPFTSENVVALLHEVARGITRPPSSYAPEIPSALDATLLRALSRDPDHRFHSTAELVSRLLPFASDRAVRAYRALLEDGESGDHPVPSKPPPRAEITAEFALPSDAPRRPGRASSLAPDGPSHVRALAPPGVPHIEPMGPAPRRISEDAITLASSASAAPTPSPLLAGSAATASSAAPTQPSSEVASSSSAPLASAAPPRMSRRGLVLGIAVLFLAAVGAGWWLLPTAQRTPPIERVEPAVTSEPTSPEAPTRSSEGSAPPPTETVAASPPPSRMHVVVVAFPSHASLSLDGAEPVIGSLDQWVEVDGREHTLVVRANGFRPRTLTFVDEAPPSRVELARAAGRPGGPSSTASPPDDEEEIRSTR